MSSAKKFRSLAAWALALSAMLCGCGPRHFTVSLLPPLLPTPRPPIVWRESFDALSLDQWREVEVKRRTRYQVVDLEGHRCLQAESQDGGSILLSAVRFDPETYAWFSWRWRVDQLVAGEALEHKDGSDAAARVYVYFETKGLPWQKRSLDYVWSASLPAGTILSSAYSSESKIIVVESGEQHLGQWQDVERNLEDDYERCFGTRHLPDVIAIGLMSDTDNTGGSALAYFDELRVRR